MATNTPSDTAKKIANVAEYIHKPAIRIPVYIYSAI
jgi:hypothetical protein